MATTKYQTALVIAAGAFGTSLASVLATNFRRVILLVRSRDVYEALEKKENSVYLPGQKLSSRIVPALNFKEVKSKILGSLDLIVSGLPTSAIVPFCRENKDSLESFLSENKKLPFLSLAKGIDSETLELPDDLYFQHFQDYRDQFAFLSGPSFAREIIDKQITLVSVAGRSRSHLQQILLMLQTDYFSAFPTYDVKGVLIGGALKNVLAIAGGLVEGLGYNDNTRAALITRGIAELLQFGVVFNARPETFYGLSGMGDLILTTTGSMSRNKWFGMEIARGQKIENLLGSQRHTVEGYKTAKAAQLLSEKYEIKCKIFQSIYRVLYEEMSPLDFVKELMRYSKKMNSLFIS